MRPLTSAPPHGPAHRSVAALAIGTVELALTTTACTAPVVAVAGIGVDHLGRPLGYLQICGGHIDGAAVDAIDGSEPELGRWTATKPVTTFAAWSLAESQSGWNADGTLQEPTPGVEYRLSGWTDDHSATAREVRFTAPELTQLQPGQVLYWAGDLSSTKERRSNVVVSEPEFRRGACGGLRR